MRRDFDQHIINEVRTRREALNITQADLSLLMRFKSNSFIAALESNDIRKSYSASHYNDLAIILQCSVHDLVRKEPFFHNDIIKVKNSRHKQKILAAIGKDIPHKTMIPDMFDIAIGNKIYLAFYEINLDRYLAVDEHKAVYLIMLDQKPNFLLTDIVFAEELNRIQQKKPAYQQHLPGKIISILEEPSRLYKQEREDNTKG